MASRRLSKILRITLLISVIVVIAAAVVGSYYLTQEGLSSKWRIRIARELESLGVIADFESLTLDPSKGLVAEGVQIYSDDSRETMIAALENIVLDLDKTKLLRGIVRVNNVLLKETNISIPLDLTDPDSQKLIINNLSGEIYLPNTNTINAKNILGTLSGINIDIDANVWSDYLPLENEKLPPEEKQSRILQVTDILTEIKKWKWPLESEPLIKIYMEGNISKPESLMVNFALDANQLSKNEITLKNMVLNGEYKNQGITIDRFSVKDSTGSLTGSGTYQLTRKQGSFDVDSSLQIQALTKKLFGTDLLEELVFKSSPDIKSKGQISFDEEYKMNLQLTGTASSDTFSFLSSDFASLSTSFSAKDNNIFLNDLHITHSQGELKGRVLIEKDEIRYEAESSLPVTSYSPFIESSAFEKAMGNTSFTPESRSSITTEGTMNRHDITDWASKGHAEITNTSYNGTAITTLSGQYDLTKETSTFTGIQADFGYSDYQLRKDHGGPISGQVSVKSIAVNHDKNTVKINDAHGNAWPAPIVRLFDSETADYIEKYRFHSPPTFSAQGVLGAAKANNNNFTVKISSSNTMSYGLLNKDISLSNLRSEIQLLGENVKTKNLTFQTFNGPCQGNITINTASKQPQYSGTIKGQGILFTDICTAYGLDDNEQGSISGDITFRGEYGKIETLNATGELVLKNGNAFSAPIFAPVTPLVGVILGKRNPKETTSNASCHYTITNGIFHYSDFLASTPSLLFTGEASIDLAQMKTEAIIRMNARDVLDITPNKKKPFMGIFQFQGSGSFIKPNWKSTRLTKPIKGANDPVFKNN